MARLILLSPAPPEKDDVRCYERYFSFHISITIFKTTNMNGTFLWSKKIRSWMAGDQEQRTTSGRSPAQLNEWDAQSMDDMTWLANMGATATISDDHACPPNSGLSFSCPRCGTRLKAFHIPEKGPCPACDSPINLRAGMEPKKNLMLNLLSWVLAILLLVAIILGGLLVSGRLDLSGLSWNQRDPGGENRFAASRWTKKQNVNCTVPPHALSGIGWDERGHSHALIDRSFIAISHNTAPENVSFLDINGRILRRSIISTHTLCTDENGLPWLRICRLNKPLPTSVLPLPLLDAPDGKEADIPLYLASNDGRIDMEQAGCFYTHHKSTSHLEKPQSIGVFITPHQKGLAGYAKLKSGDSGSPLIARKGNEWCLVGLACAVGKPGEDNQIERLHIYTLLATNSKDMALAGASPRVTSFDEEIPDKIASAY
jgi:hypothetical protein